jgi:general secretion pathway protein H
MCRRLSELFLPVRSTCGETHSNVGNRPQPWRSEDGFTLVELLITLALLGLIAVLSFPYVSGGKSAAGLTSDARVLASRFRAAREMALAARAKTFVIIDLVRPGVRGPEGLAVHDFGAAERVSVTTAKGQVTGESAQITFGPDGGSSGGVVVLENGPQLRSVKVEWLTGTVSITGDIQ